MIRLIAFLGNHGREYEGNRHNVAWMLADAMGIASGLTWKRQFKGLWAKAPGPSGELYLLKPETYMNRSGESVAELMRFFKLGPDELLVAHDELELPFGTIGFKMGGGLGGHNGLRSIKASLGTADFARFRFGIGRPSHDDISGYVLSDFDPRERDALISALPAAAREIEECIASGIEAAVARCPKRSLLC
jgi:PTH1 family peptidyl-tRNA hydrolase